jgi:hypothetical protein
MTQRSLLHRGCLIGVDGLGAAGKSSFADQLAERVHGAVVRVDDLSQPGVLPWEIGRFLSEIVEPLVQGRPARYRRWHWTASSPGEWLEVPTGVPVILEGVRSTDLANRAPFDLRIWLEVPEQVRLDRARRRDPDRFSCWTTNWMPREAAWAAEQQPMDRADLVVDYLAADDRLPQLS